MKYKIKHHDFIIHVSTLLALLGILLWITGNGSHLIDTAIHTATLGYIVKCEYLQELLEEKK